MTSIHKCNIYIPSVNKFGYLSGAVDEVEYDASSSALKANLETAKKIVDYTQRAIPFSPNHRQRCVTNCEELNKGDLGALTFRLIRTVRGTSPTGLWDRICFRDEVAWSAKLAEENGVGNCREMANVGYMHAKRVHPLFPVQRALHEHEDHAFLLVGDDKNKDPYTPDSDVVVCDPWSGAVFPAHLRKDYQHCYEIYEDRIFPSSVKDK